MIALAATRLQPAPYRPPAFVAHGSLRVAAIGETDFEAAAKYLSRDSMMEAIVQRAEHCSRPLTLTLNAHDDDSFDPNTDTVHWDPHSALQTTLGGTQTPALGLGHELDHATVAPALEEKGSGRYIAGYDNAEERRVITGSEAHAALTLGEGLRYDHAGTSYRVHSPTER